MTNELALLRAQVRQLEDDVQELAKERQKLLRQLPDDVRSVFETSFVGLDELPPKQGGG
jgi:predicted  nucleic acid-binding Zn-ribbon protein